MCGPPPPMGGEYGAPPPGMSGYGYGSQGMHQQHEMTPPPDMVAAPPAQPAKPPRNPKPTMDMEAMLAAAQEHMQKSLTSKLMSIGVPVQRWEQLANSGNTETESIPLPGDPSGVDMDIADIPAPPPEPQVHLPREEQRLSVERGISPPGMEEMAPPGLGDIMAPPGLGDILAPPGMDDFGPPGEDDDLAPPGCD